MSEQTAVEQAQAEVGRLLALERQWTKAEREKRAILAELQATAASLNLLQDQDAVLDRSRELNGQLVELESHIRTAGQTILAARVARRDAIVAKFQVEGQELRTQAAALRQEADAREPRTKELLAQLKEHEGCDWEPAGPQPVNYNFLGTVYERKLPRTDELRQQAVELDRKAQETATQRVREAGTAEGSSADELVSLACSSWWAIGPLESDIRSWVAEATDQELVRRARIPTYSDTYIPPSAPIRFHIEWRGSVLDLRACHVDVQAPWEPVPDRASLGIIEEVAVYPTQELVIG